MSHSQEPGSTATQPGKATTRTETERTSRPNPSPRDWFPRRQLPFWGLVGLTAFAIFLCYQLVRPFLSAVLWAIGFAVLANPFYRWLCRKVRFRSLAAAVSVLAVGLILVLPTVALAPRLASEAASAVDSISKSAATSQWREKLLHIKGVSQVVKWVESSVDLTDLSRRIVPTLTTGISSVVKGSVTGFIQFLVSGFLLFYLFREQDEALAALKSLLPITTIEADMLFQRFSDTVYAIIYGKLVTAVIQGILGGVGFWILGVSAPWFWGLVMGVLSFLPVVGASLVWGPAALILTLDGHIGRALVLVLWGILIVAPVESLLYPILVGHRLRLHNAFVVIAVLGGLVAFGAVGLFIGPAILALTLGLESLWRERLAAAKLATHG